MKKKRIIYYENFDQDFAESKNQEYRLPENYNWIGSKKRRAAGITLYPLILLTGLIYMKFVARIRIKNRKVLKKARGGYFLYSNHTLEFGDVINSFIITWPKRPKIICITANLGIAVLGSWLPAAGALPLPEDIKGMKKLTHAIKYHITKGKPVIIYPEGHMWPYYTKIRPFAEASFHYAISNQAPSFTATTTFSKPKLRKRPKTTIYIDGPFTPDESKNRKDQQKELAKTVKTAMEKRSRLSTYKYIEYRKKA